MVVIRVAIADQLLAKSELILLSITMEGTPVDVEVSELHSPLLHRKCKSATTGESSVGVVGPRASAFVPVGTTAYK